jgi:halocyanin-like protein
MSDTPTVRRRSVLRVSAAGLLAAVAGCAGGSGGGTESTPEPSDTPTATESGGATATSSGDSGGSTDSGGSGDFGGWLSNVGNYDGVVDETGSDSVTIQVGSEANGGNFGYSPAAVRVSAGTEVVWEWTGKGGSHNVVEESEAWSSELTDAEGHTFSKTFESAGTVKYFCTPHKSIGMKGVVVVE